MVAISIRDAEKKGFPGDRLAGDLGSHLGALTCWRWDHYCTYAEEEVTLEDDKRLAALFLVNASWSCLFLEDFSACVRVLCSVCFNTNFYGDFHR